MYKNYANYMTIYHL